MQILPNKNIQFSLLFQESLLREDKEEEGCSDIKGGGGGALEEKKRGALEKKERGALEKRERGGCGAPVKRERGG